MKSDDIETHILELNDTRFRITNDPWTGDWCVDSPDELVQGTYLASKKGAINYCLVEASIVKRSEVEYEMAPDRTF